MIAYPSELSARKISDQKNADHSKLRIEVLAAQDQVSCSGSERGFVDRATPRCSVSNIS
jgi:hypothetical protein